MDDYNFSEYGLMQFMAQEGCVPLEKFKQVYYLLYNKAMLDTAEGQYQDLLNQVTDESYDADSSYC